MYCTLIICGSPLVSSSGEMICEWDLDATGSCVTRSLVHSWVFCKKDRMPHHLFGLCNDGFGVLEKSIEEHRVVLAHGVVVPRAGVHQHLQSGIEICTRGRTGFGVQEVVRVGGGGGSEGGWAGCFLNDFPPYRFAFTILFTHKHTEARTHGAGEAKESRTYPRVDQPGIGCERKIGSSRRCAVRPKQQPPAQDVMHRCGRLHASAFRNSNDIKIRILLVLELC